MKLIRYDRLVSFEPQIDLWDIILNNTLLHVINDVDKNVDFEISLKIVGVDEMVYTDITEKYVDKLIRT